MEKVHFQQEQMLPELKALHKLGIFTASETSQIYKTRTQFERKLIRRVAQKEDYLKYIEYEANLEALRAMRWERISPEKDKMAEHCITRRQLYIFERAVKKFKGDVGLWVEYVQCAQRMGSRALAGRVCARAIQMHPSTPGLYILATTVGSGTGYETPDATRAMLQRGLRMNEKSEELWLEYVKFELGFIEVLRRRWEVLGAKMEAGVEEVMRGAVVKTVIAEGLKAVGDTFVESVTGVIREFPCGLDWDDYVTWLNTI